MNPLFTISDATRWIDQMKETLVKVNIHLWISLDKDWTFLVVWLGNVAELIVTCVETLVFSCVLVANKLETLNHYTIDIFFEVPNDNSFFFP